MFRLLAINSRHVSDRMPLSVTAYVLDWRGLPSMPSGGLVTSRLPPQAECLTDLHQLDVARLGPGLNSIPSPGNQSPTSFSASLGGDLSGTIATILDTSDDNAPYWYIQPPLQPGYGDQAARVDYASTDQAATALAMSYVHQTPLS
ncbi:hypothetical protein [Streptomyces luteolus]|uniref:Uncharacterized protein n=1 Tax=Streptomyces luteolus TaxID=3043615 RepID=A0ABT6SZ34_9ACTN|nr:hypothetical protein [Streptomyces sp. B-S-A12]MDI3420661.1 hypothetical protein [Streptomyces sp. B-S-A12]